MTEEEKIICKQFLNDADKTHSCNEYKLLMALLQQEPTIRNCFGCKYSKDNHNAGTEECHLCMWKNQYTPTTKNDLRVDCISREQVLGLKIHAPIAPVLYSDNSVHYEDIIFVKDVNKLPSVTPQELKWIPVSEKLPEENGGYWITLKGGYVMTALWTGNDEYWGEVIAWMPLPKAYSEVEE